ncbi:hypothetical protein Q4Q39_12105 [Flavivirga amylovorans]|uniref:SMODS-associating 2TM beta-strand rich effector domain-containing protein n=1 Tax=Flavivirga amylovorans TaxID=870486 RepID=A0ABT8X356_9FLAO|nr:hypothetical protein [Flavivirga amylovorans]MDO5988148.1 hypothetical protein [Flavivirga amylovorans]
MNKHIIVSEKGRPLWQRIIASLFFTTAIGLLAYILYMANWNDNNITDIGHSLESVIYLMGIGIAFSFHKSVYIDTKKSKFRQTFEIGPIRLGQWITISNYEYVSIFHQPLEDGEKIFEVNLWYDRNKHWELYEKYDYTEAFLIGYEISELLQISILDATVPNNYRWIDKKASKETGKMVYLD